MFVELINRGHVGELQVQDVRTTELPDLIKIERDNRFVKFLTHKLESTSDKKLSGEVIYANQSVLVRPGLRVRPQTGHLVVSYNTELLKYGAVSVPGPISAKESGLFEGDNSEVLFRFDCKKKVDLSKFSYLIKLGIMI